MAGTAVTSGSAPLVLIGGGPAMLRRRGPDPLLQAIFAAVAAPRPAIAYVGAASGDDQGFLTRLSAWFAAAGAGRVNLVPLAGRRPDRRRAVSVLEAADLVFISGGDVDTGMAALQRQRVVPLLTDLYRRGKPFLGVSAGSIMLGRSWLRWRDPDDDDTIETFPCLGLAPLSCDTHAEEDDWMELKSLLASGVESEGYGIPGGAALRVDAGGSVSALGGAVERFRIRSGRVFRLPPLLPDLPAAETGRSD